MLLKMLLKMLVNYITFTYLPFSHMSIQYYQRKKIYIVITYQEELYIVIQLYIITSLKIFDSHIYYFKNSYIIAHH